MKVTYTITNKETGELMPDFWITQDWTIMEFHDGYYAEVGEVENQDLYEIKRTQVKGDKWRYDNLGIYHWPRLGERE